MVRHPHQEHRTREFYLPKRHATVTHLCACEVLAARLGEHHGVKAGFRREGVEIYARTGSLEWSTVIDADILHEAGSIDDIERQVVRLVRDIEEL